MISKSIDSQSVAADLKKLIAGEVLWKEWQRSMYATDASSYEIMPLCVVFPKTKTDIIAIVKYAFEKRISVIARGGGSGLAGQAIGSGIIIDFSRHLNRVKEFNPDLNFVVAEPGIFKSVLDRHLAKSGKFLPPDPSSSDYCTLGGMLANNGCGPHTVKYGAIIDYVLTLEVLLYNGEVIQTQPVSVDEEKWRELTTSETVEARLYTEIRTIVEENQELIQRRVPKVRKNASGYRLERVLESRIFDLGKLFVASEGTLGIILEAKLRVLDQPSKRGVGILEFKQLEKTGHAVGEILKLEPSALELLDSRIVDLAAALYPELKNRLLFELKALLLVEFDGWNMEEIKDKFEKLRQLLESKVGLVDRVHIALDPDEIKKLWEIRKKALPFAYKYRKGGKRPIAFIEDTVVDPQMLGHYIKALYEIYDKYGIEGVIYGHAGDGHLHTRPLLDLKDSHDIEIMEKVASEVFALAKKLGGSITGEHGDGLARAEFIKFLYGDEMYALFGAIKRLCDPLNILNPGKKIIEEGHFLVKNLRYGTNYERREIKTALNWSTEGNKLLSKITGYEKELDYGSQVELCHGCGYCRETSYSGRMCPVFKGLGNEVDSCRGRNNLLRWMLKTEGLAKEFEFTDEYRDAVYKHCIQCKMCSVDCPSNVDVGKLMAEARARYAQVRGLPKGYGFFMDLDKYGEMGCKHAGLSNWMLKNRFCRVLIEWLSGIDRYRTFPPFSSKTFREVFSEYEPILRKRDLNSEAVFFYDTFLNYNNPDLGMAIVKILERNGVRAVIPEQKSSGLPALVEGAPDIGKKIAEYNTSRLMPYVEKGIPIVCFSPSAGLALKLEYLNVLDTRDSRMVADNTVDVHEFLFSMYKEGRISRDLQPLSKDVLIHFHCHTVVQKVDKDVLGILSAIPELKLDVLERGCCGVGGSYSFIKGNYKPSLAMGRELFEAVKTSKKPVYTTGESCMLQMSSGAETTVGLTTELLAQAFGIT